MGHVFLSDDWFAEVKSIVEGVGDLGLPDIIKDLKINLEVSDGPDGTRGAHMAAGVFGKGLLDDAPTKLKLPYELAVKLFIEEDQAAGMQAFMSGQIQVEGDMSKMMAMQAGGGPTEPQKKVSEAIKAMTVTS